MIAEFTWLIPFIPMMCFLMIGIFGKKTPEKGGYIAIAGALLSFLIALAATSSQTVLQSRARSAGSRSAITH